MAPPTLLTLPVEIRNVIYNCVIPEEVHLHCCADEDEYSYREVHGPYMQQGIKDVHRQRLYLLLTCKKINEEVSRRPTSRFVLNLGSETCFRSLITYQRPGEYDTVRGIQIETKSRYTSYQVRGHEKNNGPITRARSNDHFNCLLSRFNDVKLQRAKRYVEFDECRVLVWSLEYFEVAGGLWFWRNARALPEYAEGNESNSSYVGC